MIFDQMIFLNPAFFLDYYYSIINLVSSLLRSPPSDDEITLNTVSSKKKGKQPAPIKNRIQFTSHRSYKPLQQHPSNLSDNEDDSDSI
ncbi:unnamed protein product [Cunninghamella echinulata]